MEPCVTFVTSNVNKLREVKAILEPTIRVQSMPLDLDEVQGSINDIAEYKCRKAADLVDGPVLVEDTALCFNALGGLPGPYVKWFLSTIGLDGLNNLLAAYTDKSAEAVCTFGFSAGPGQQPVLFQGRCPGKIVPQRGPSHFGWDPIFEYQGLTYAEMDASQKNTISHRARALQMVADWLKTRPGSFALHSQGEGGS